MSKNVRLKLFLLVPLLLFFFVTPAAAQEIRVTVYLENASLKEIFNTIEKQSSYRFSYRDILVDSLENKVPI